MKCGNMETGRPHRVIFALDENCWRDLERQRATAASPSNQNCQNDDDDDNMKQEWRRYGAARRKALVEKDEQEGGTRFQLQKKCRVEQYFHIADRVLRDFRAKCDDCQAGLDETYVMGHRLLAFLGTALPQHPEYNKASASAFRTQATLDLEWIQDKMMDIALKIDEEELNVYITMDFDPLPDDDSTISSSEADFTKFADFTATSGEGWEEFTDWAFPSAVETDASSSFNTSGDDSTPGGQSSASEHPDPFDDPEIVFELDEEDSTAEKEDPVQVEVQPLPQAFVKFSDEDDRDSASEGSSRYGLNDVGTASSFLKQIAKEEVRYETDSEAVDSWAQDGETGSRASSGTLPTFDPARIAFREIMNKVVPKTSLSPAPPAPSPLDDARRRRKAQGEASDQWASFDFASIRQIK